jgi:hypothetical protein
VLQAYHAQSHLKLVIFFNGPRFKWLDPECLRKEEGSSGKNNDSGSKTVTSEKIRCHNHYVLSNADETFILLLAT